MRILCFKKQNIYVEYYAGNLPKSTFLHHVPSTVNFFLLASKCFFRAAIFYCTGFTSPDHWNHGRLSHISTNTWHDFSSKLSLDKFLLTQFGIFGLLFPQRLFKSLWTLLQSPPQLVKGDGNLTVFAHAFYMRVLSGGVLNFKNQTPKTTQITSWYMIRSRGCFLQPSYSISFFVLNFKHPDFVDIESHILSFVIKKCHFGKFPSVAPCSGEPQATILPSAMIAAKALEVAFSCSTLLGEPKLENA